MEGFVKTKGDIYRLKVPYDTVYTSVFLIKNGEEYALVDCATTPYDVTEYILPAIGAMGISLAQIKTLVLTHGHEDHAGGREELLRQCPHIECVTESKALWNGVETYPLSGHTRDCIGVLDTRSSLLISADGIQGYGVGKYRCTVQDTQAYLQTLEKIEKDERIENLLFSHAYEPWYKDYAFGRKEVEKCLQDSYNYIIQKEKIQ